MGTLMSIAVFLVALGSYYVFFGDHFDPSTLRNKRVLVTGASSGIGEQVAYYYSQHGARLVITARRENLLKNVSRTCLKLGARQVQVVAADMAKPEDRSRVIEMTKKTFGGLDHLILNHAIIRKIWWHGTAEDLALFGQIFQVNCFSYVDLASKSLEMLTKSKGNIGIVSSGFGEVGTATATLYATSKFALHGFFSSLRQELRANNSGISVTIMVLGPVATEVLLELHTENASQMPVDIFLSTESAARAIVECVCKRYYKVRCQMLKYLLMLYDLFPKLGEDSLSDILLEKEGTFWKWMGVPLFQTAAFLSQICG